LGVACRFLDKPLAPASGAATEAHHAPSKRLRAEPKKKGQGKNYRTHPDEYEGP